MLCCLVYRALFAVSDSGFCEPLVFYIIEYKKLFVSLHLTGSPDMDMEKEIISFLKSRGYTDGQIKVLNDNKLVTANDVP